MPKNTSGRSPTRNRAIEIDAYNTFAWFNQGLTLANLERYDEAIEPDNSYARRSRERILMLKEGDVSVVSIMYQGE